VATRKAKAKAKAKDEAHHAHTLNVADSKQGSIFRKSPLRKWHDVHKEKVGRVKASRASAKKAIKRRGGPKLRKPNP
jgi:hypothetical protein